jgi:hypothetical protein
VDWKDWRFIKQLYIGQRVAVRIEEEETEETSIGRGVRQGWSMSQILFNIYGEN